MIALLPQQIQSLVPAQPATLTAPFWQGESGGGPGLQYRASDGPWFERLCFRLMLREGHAAHYFGRNGQAQFGIDFVSTKDAQFWCWQCKNLAEPLNATNLAAWVKKFENEALNREKISPPACFVIFCANPLKDVATSEEFLALHQRLGLAGIALELRGREMIDVALKAAPDIVAEMFGNQAVTAHCDLADWRPDLWWAVGDGALPGRLRSYQEASRQGLVWHDATGKNSALTKLLASVDEREVTVVCGMSGAGKTFLALAACTSLPGWRCYYLHLPAEHGTAAHVIAEAMLQHLSYPTLFVIDDVHVDFDKIANVLDKFKAGAGNRSWRVVCTARRAGVGDGDDERSDGHDFLDQVEMDGGLLPLALDNAALCRFIKNQRPDWVAVGKSALVTLANGCGRNLRLIREACKTLEMPDGLSPEDIKQAVLRPAREAYFKHDTARPTWFRFAALAAYDIDPRTDYFPRDARADIGLLKVDELVWVFERGYPACFSAEHPAAAELLMHAMVVEDIKNGTLPEQCATCLTNYCVWVHENEGDEALLAMLQAVLETKPTLIPPDNDLALKAVLLSDVRLREPWVNAACRHRLALLANAMGVCRLAGDPMAQALAQQYLTEVRRRVTESGPLVANELGWVGKLGWGVRDLHRSTPNDGTDFWDSFQIEVWLLIFKKEILQNLLRLLPNAQPPFAERLIGALDDTLLDAIFSNTVQVGRSLGTLDFALRELGLHDARHQTCLLTNLEQKIGPHRWLDLMGGGTLPDLLHLLQRSNPAFAAQLIEALDGTLLDAVFSNTVQAGRSLGTLHMALWELGSHDSRHQTCLLADLEQKICPRRWLCLMMGGTLPDLLHLLQYSTTTFAPQLIATLDDTLLNAIFSNTVQAGCSLGTLGFSLRELGLHDARLKTCLLADLEQKIGTQRWLGLMTGCTLPDFLNLLQYSSPAFATQLIAALDGTLLDTIFSNTAQAGRSLGTINLSLNALGKRGGQKTCFELAIGQQRMATVLLGCGTLGAIHDVLPSLSASFGAACLELLWAQPDDAWQRCALRAEPAKRFFHLCQWIGKFGLTMQTAAPGVLASLVQCALEWVPQQAWYALRGGLDCLPPPTTLPSTAPLLHAIAQYVAQTSAASFAAADWNDLAHAPHLFWHSRTDLRQPWADSVVAQFERTPDDVALFAMTVPRLLCCMHLAEFSPVASTAILQQALQPPRIATLLQADNVAAPFHYLWGASAAAYERQVDAAHASAKCWFGFIREFGKSAPAETQAKVAAWLKDKTAKPIPLPSYAPLLALAGLMQLLGWPLPATPGLKWENNGRRFSIWQGMANTQHGFVFASLLQLGARAVMDDKAAFREDRCALLAEKYDAMCATTATFPRHRAVDDLAKWVQQEGQRAQQLAQNRNNAWRSRS